MKTLTALAASAASLAKIAGLRAFALFGLVQLGLAVVNALARYAETRQHLAFRRELLQVAKELPAPDRTLVLRELARIPSALPATSEPTAATTATSAATAPEPPEPVPGPPP
ncbi:hypothetical protein ACIBJF_42320 [Streptomyces sp. NPDC050743]|uniref:hypothetical protein n=1 Tax=Streptomyces sp. NPDC050743 TaxID=3365634 RepID=UPI00379F2343